jgi:ATP-binding cassette, subfamily B, multidrug efflux pump
MVQKNILRRVMTLAKPYFHLWFSALVLIFVLTPLAILRPYLIQYTIDNTILKPDYGALNTWIAIIIGVLFLEMILTYSFTQITNRLGQNVIFDLRNRVFQHILSLKLRYFDTTPNGTSVTRTISDVETINAVFSEGLITISADILTILAVLAVMFATSWQLSLVSLVTVPILLGATWWFKEGVKNASQIVRTQVANMNAFLQERISGMRIVQLFNAEKKEIAEFETINLAYRKANVDTVFHYALFFPIVEILSAVSTGLMVWYGASFVLKHSVSLGVLIAFPLYLNILFRPIRILADKFNTLQMGLIAAERVFALLDDTDLQEGRTLVVAQTQDERTLVVAQTQDERTLVVAQTKDERTLVVAQTEGQAQGTTPTNEHHNEQYNEPHNAPHDVIFENVSFRYTPEIPVLQGLSFRIPQGETLAIVGATGSGKTTITNLLNRFYPIESGRILIGHTDIQSIALTALRQKIGVVLQDVFLFSGTILENITLRNAAISREEVQAAAALIGADAFIQKLPQGYDFQVQERGAMLSAGQRQLISFVRALVYDPEILILDEATANIDPETEQLIQYATQKLIAQRTSIVIAHRLTTVRNAQQIMVLEKGEIREIGTHESLVEQGGWYAGVYER